MLFDRIDLWFIDVEALNQRLRWLERTAVDEERWDGYEVIGSVFVVDEGVVGWGIENVGDGEYFEMVGADGDCV